MNAQLEPLRLVALSGNVQRPSKSRALAETIATAIASKLPVRIEQYDILDAQPGLGASLTRSDLPADTLRVVEAIEAADVLVVSTPTYKASYPGLFKHLIDFVDMGALDGRPVVLSATAGSSRHALVVEHQLRPLFSFFSAATIPAGIFAEDKTFSDGRPADAALLTRIDVAARQVAAWFPERALPAKATEDATG